MQLITTQENSLPLALSITSSRVEAKAMNELLEENNYMKNNKIPGDKGYNTNPLQLRLFEQKDIELKAQPRENMKSALNWTPRMGAIIHLIETNSIIGTGSVPAKSEFCQIFQRNVSPILLTA